MNIFKLNFLIKFRKKAIEIYEKMKENITAMIAKKFNSVLSSLRILRIPRTLAAAKAGIDKKNEILAESYLLKPKNLPDVIVIPDLLTPGIKART